MRVAQIAMLQPRYLIITPLLQACEEDMAGKDAAQKLSFAKNKQVARLHAELKRQRALNAEARAAVAAADAADADAADAADAAPPTLLLGTLYGHELYGGLGGVELHGRAPHSTAAVPTRILSSCGAPSPLSADEVAPG